MKHFFIFILIILQTNYAFSQQVEIKSVLDSVFCKPSLTFNYKELYIQETNTGIFNYSPKPEPSCLNVITYKTESDFIKHLKKNKKVYLITQTDKSEPTQENVKTILFSVGKATKKSYKKKQKVLLHEDDFEVNFIKNKLTGIWEINKIKYPPRIQSIIGK